MLASQPKRRVSQPLCPGHSVASQQRRIPASSPTLSADTSPTRHERLLNALEAVPDPRDRRGVRYPLAGMLALAVTATVAGCRSFTAIGQWATETAADKLASFGLSSGSAPDESTLRKLFARIDADAFDRALGVWMWTRTFTVDRRRVIALDGKTVRGARTRPDGKAPHLVAAYDHRAGGRPRTSRRRGEEQRNTRRPNTVGAARSRRRSGDHGCDAHPRLLGRCVPWAA